MYNQYLAIGTVVMLKGEGKKVMVIGYFGQDSQGHNVDYMGVVYPQGYLSEDAIVGFDQNEVIQVLHEGYKDLEQERFFNQLRAYEEGMEVQSSPTVPYQKPTVPVNQNPQSVQMPQVNNNQEDIDTFE